MVTGEYRKAGGARSTHAAMERLGYRSARQVLDAVSSRRLFTVQDNGANLYPAFQFDGGSVLSGMCDILEATPNVSPWSILRFMVVGDEGLGADLPMNLIRQGDEAIDRAVRFARTLGD